jgi:digeranylgeranylglycerophospholipid reductase
MQFTDEVVIESPNDHYVQSRTGAVLEFADFKNFLVEDAREQGAEFRFDARVSKPVTEGDEPVGVRYSGDEEVYGEMIVDATGPSAPLAKALDVSDLQRDHQAIGIEHEFEGIDLDHPGYADLNDAMMLRLDHRYAPGGYSWIFHTGEDTAKVGVCFIQNESYKEHASADRTVDGYLQHWIDTDPRFENATRMAGKTHRGSAHIQPPGVSMSTDRFMAIGDTVPTIDPLWGEGIHVGMKSGRAAATTVDHCLTPREPDTSAGNVALYDELWHRDVAPDMNTRLAMTELLYLAPNERYDRLVRDLNALDGDTLSEANEGDKLALSKLIHLDDLPLLAKFARYRYAG